MKNVRILLSHEFYLKDITCTEKKNTTLKKLLLHSTLICICRIIIITPCMHTYYIG